MKKYLLFFLVIVIFLTGCWDQRMIKDARLVYASAFDIMEDGKVMTTSVMRGFIAAGETGGGKPRNEIARAPGYNLRHTRMNIDHKIANTFNPSKNRVFLYSEKIARQGLYPYLDIFYRDATSALNSKVVITEGEAGRYLELRQKENTLIGEFIEEMIVSGEFHTVIPKIDVQSVCPLFFDEGKDPYIPYIELNEEKQEIKLKGVALFNDDKMTGFLDDDESKLLLILHGKTARITRLVRKVHENEKQDVENFAAVHVNKAKSKMKVTPLSDGTITTSFDIKLQVNLVEYPRDNLTSEKEVNYLNKKLSEILTKDMNEVLEKVKEANSDPFGIGLELKAFHPEVWEKLDWKKDYPEINTEAKVNVEIVSHGIIN